MEIIVVLFGPMVLVWLALAAMPRGVPFLVAFGFAMALLIAGALAPLPPSNGPDDWFRGIGRAGAILGLVAAGAVLPAQGLRWWRGLGGGAYFLTLLGCALVAFVLMTSFGTF
nr:hypothetical protein [Amylibacter sp.]